jgi:hypothetical protein
MNEYLMLGIVGIVAAIAAFGASWIGRAISGNKNKDKPS